MPRYRVSRVIERLSACRSGLRALSGVWADRDPGTVSEARDVEVNEPNLLSSF